MSGSRDVVGRAHSVHVTGRRRVRAHVLVLAAVALFASACATTGRSGGSQVHIVRRGDTVWGIAERYGTTIAAVARANGLADPSRIRIGQRLVIPSAHGPVEISDGPSVGLRPSPALRGTWIWPVEGQISSAFGRRWQRAHTGVDIVAPRGARIYASAAGRVTYAAASGTGYGTMVVIEHDSAVATLYAHNSRNLVREGQWVKQGAPIATVGETGHATGPHVHFEIRVNDVPQDPVPFLPPLR